MPTCLALDATGTQVAVPLRYVGGAEAVLTMARVILSSLIGDWPEDRGMGLDWLGEVLDPSTPLVQIEGRVRRQLLDIPGLAEVREVIATKAGGAVAISVVLAIVEKGIITIARLGGDSGTHGPGAWYSIVSVSRVAP